MKRLPTLKKLESMRWQDAVAILDTEANKTRDCIAHEFMWCGKLGRSGNYLRRRLKRIYAIADDHGFYIGQPDYKPPHYVANADERAHRERWQAMYEGDIICRSIGAEQAAA